MKILNALLALKEQALSGSVNEPLFGICRNLSSLTGCSWESYSFVSSNCEDWEYFSGDSAYPIVGYDEEPMWEGEQLVLRLSLLDHLIAKAKILES